MVKHFQKIEASSMLMGGTFLKACLTRYCTKCLDVQHSSQHDETYIRTNRSGATLSEADQRHYIQSVKLAKAKQEPCHLISHTRLAIANASM